MSVSIFNIHIQTNKVEEVQGALANWLSNTHRKEVVTFVEQDSDFPFFEREIPSLFALSRLNENWICILHDAYEPPFTLANIMSETFARPLFKQLDKVPWTITL